MKTWILPIAVLSAVALTACERTVVTPPSNTAVVTPVPVPGPAGAPGPQGAPGKPGESTTVVVTPPMEPKKN